MLGLGDVQEPEEELRIAVEAALEGWHFALPVRVTKDSDGKTASLQPTVKAVQTMPDGTTQLVDYPQLDGLVKFASGGGTTFTHPIKEGDEGLAIFSSRSFHNWRERGGQQPQVDGRRHDLSDATYIAGIRSKPRDLTNISTTSAQMRSDDGKHLFDMHPQTGPTMSADNGKHVVKAHPTDGVSIKTTTKLAVDAAQGSTFKGMAHFEDDVTSAKSIGAPVVNGQTGGPFTGMLPALIGAVVGTLVTLALQGHDPSEGLQRARYALAALSSW